MNIASVAVLVFAVSVFAVPTFANSLPPISLYGQISGVYYTSDAKFAEFTTQNIVNGPWSFSSGSGPASIAGNYTTSGLPLISEYGRAYSVDKQHGTDIQEDIGMSYYFNLDGPAGKSVPIIVAATGQGSGVGANSRRGFEFGQYQPSVISFVSDQQTKDFTYKQTFYLTPGDTYYVNMFADLDISASQNRLEGTLMIDPVFTIDPTFVDAAQYQLVFSDGIANLPAVATPLPATLPLLAIGLGGLSLLGWRRKRQGHAPTCAL